MSKPKPYLAPSLVQLRNEVNAEWPDRSTASDGWIGDARHQREVSDHNPDPKGCVHAIDVTSAGIDPDHLVQVVISDEHDRARYVIWDHHIWQRDQGWAKREYHGASPHTEHVHISIMHTTHAEIDTHDWNLTMPLNKADALLVLNTPFARNLNDPHNTHDLIVDMQTFAERTDAKLDALTAQVAALGQLVQQALKP